MEKRVVITGIGVVSPVGIGKEAFWESIKKGKSGARRITRFDTTNFPVKIAHEVKDFEPLKFIDEKDARRMDRFAQFGLATTKMAIEDAKLNLEEEDKEKIGVCIGAVTGGVEFGEKEHKKFVLGGINKVGPFLATAFQTDTCAAWISLKFKLKGISSTISTACASGASAVGYAFNLIKRKRLNICFAGGAEAPITPIFMLSLIREHAMSERDEEPEKVYCPFDLRRDGFVIGEGSCIMVLEELEHALRRKANIYAEIKGVSLTCDAYHWTSPEPDPKQVVRAMKEALFEAKINPERVDYINAHGSGTRINDSTETKAIKEVFGEYAYNLAVSSTKSIHGHLMGATGATEIAVSCLAIKDQVVPPTINYKYPDPECDLDYVPNQARMRRINVAMSNSFGFGGKNTVVILSKFE